MSAFALYMSIKIFVCNLVGGVGMHKKVTEKIDIYRPFYTYGLNLWSQVLCLEGKYGTILSLNMGRKQCATDWYLKIHLNTSI